MQEIIPTKEQYYTVDKKYHGQVEHWSKPLNLTRTTMLY